jgi:hypothetical protein
MKHGGTRGHVQHSIFHVSGVIQTMSILTVAVTMDDHSIVVIIFTTIIVALVGSENYDHNHRNKSYFRLDSANNGNGGGHLVVA